MSLQIDDELEGVTYQREERDELRFRYRQGKFSRSVRRESRRRSSYAQGGVHQRRTRRWAW